MNVVYNRESIFRFVINNKKAQQPAINSACHCDFCVGVPGFEPGKTGPESVVLPLHHTPIMIHRATCPIALAKVLVFSFPTNFS